MPEIEEATATALAEEPVEQQTTEETQVAPAPAPDQTNINQLSLEDQEDEVDPTADLNAIVLPPDGLYTLRLKAGQKGVYGPTKDKDGNLLQSPKIDKNGKGFFVADMEAYIVSEDPKFDGGRLWREGTALSPGIYVTSQKNLKTGSSGAAHVANCTGYPFAAGAKIGANRDHFAQLLAGEPTIKGMIQWQATKETGETDERGYPVRVIAKRGMKNFPPLQRKQEDGSLETVYEDGVMVHNPRMEDPQDGTELVASAVITRFLPVGE